MKRLEIPVQLQLPLSHNVCRTNDQSEYTADMYFFQPEWHAFFLKAVGHHSSALLKASTYAQEINVFNFIDLRAALDYLRKAMDFSNQTPLIQTDYFF